MFQTKVIEKIKHIFHVVTFFELRAVCEVMWKNNAQPDRQQTTVWLNTSGYTHTHTHTHTHNM
jgi:hypothetical protein